MMKHSFLKRIASLLVDDGASSPDAYHSTGTDATQVEFKVRCATCADDVKGELRWKCNDCHSKDYEMDKEETPIKWEWLHDLARGDCGQCKARTTGRVYTQCSACKSEQPIVMTCQICLDDFLRETEMT